jgi:protein TonB
MFGEIANPSIKVGTQRWYTVPVSILAHVVAITAVVVVPLLATGNLPEVPSMMAFVAAPPPPPPPPPPPAAPTPRAPDVQLVDINPNAAPIEAPAEIVEETAIEPAFDISEIRGVEGGVSGGVPGDIEGGLLPAPPPPSPPVEPVRVGGVISAPVKLKDIAPEYPQVARAARVAGIVILEAVIGSDGRASPT